MDRHWVIASRVLLASLAYAVVRYIVFGGVPLSQLPVFIANKAIGVTALVLVGAASVSAGPPRAALGAAGLSLGLLHVVLSLVVLTPRYLGKLFAAGGTLTAAGEWSMLTGAIAGAIMLWLARKPTHAPSVDAVGVESLIPGAGQWILGLLALHVLTLGYSSWSDWALWPGRLPPISMLSFFVAVGFLVVRRTGWRVSSGA